MTRSRRLVGLLGAAVLGLAFLTDPVVAAGYDSSTEKLIRGLNRQLTYIAVPISLLVEGVLVYAVLRFRNNDDPKPTQERRWLEISWTVATAFILVFVGVAAYGVMAHPDVTATTQDVAGPEGEEVDAVIVGHQWYWEARYPGENVTLANADTIYLPANTNLTIAVTSADVIHSVHVPALALKQDAIPGQRSYLRTEITSTGEYQLYCAEFCGVAHSEMTATIKIVSREEFRDWLERQRESGE